MRYTAADFAALGASLGVAYGIGPTRAEAGRQAFDRLAENQPEAISAP
ncbi:hypothetical protein ACFO5K_15750 [Nocardia halotolerans]|uniref:Uncharacterized protein n=1 Tax=Nocardia halotolerans TaxID=1755878 RepID=A0ABV8VHP3_9NOCA